MLICFNMLVHNLVLDLFQKHNRLQFGPDFQTRHQANHDEVIFFVDDSTGVYRCIVKNHVQTLTIV